MKMRAGPTTPPKTRPPLHQQLMSRTAAMEREALAFTHHADSPCSWPARASSRTLAFAVFGTCAEATIWRRCDPPPPPPPYLCESIRSLGVRAREGVLHITTMKRCCFQYTGLWRGPCARRSGTSRESWLAPCLRLCPQTTLWLLFWRRGRDTRAKTERTRRQKGRFRQTTTPKGRSLSCLCCWPSRVWQSAPRTCAVASATSCSACCSPPLLGMGVRAVRYSCLVLFSR